MMNTDVVNQKVDEYRRFLDEVLAKDLAELQKVLADKVQRYEEWEEVTHVAKTLTEFKQKDRDMTVRVGLGSGVHVSGEVTDFERTYINIGLGYLLEMDCLEAEKYAKIRMKSLKRDIDHHRKLAVNVKVNIKMVLLALGELQALK